MKLRIHGNSLRLRLSQSEVAQFSKTGFVEDSIQFAPGASFAYTLESSSSLSAPQALFQNGWLRIQVPARRRNGMVQYRTASASPASNRSNPARLSSILIEKDFQCLHGDEARDPDAYPNPLEETAAPTRWASPKWKRAPIDRAPFAASFGIDPGVMTS